MEISFQDEDSVYIGDMDVSLDMTIGGDGNERSLTTLEPIAVGTPAKTTSIGIEESSGARTLTTPTHGSCSTAADHSYIKENSGGHSTQNTDCIVETSAEPSTTDTVYSTKKQYNCKSCKYSTTSSGNLSRHTRSVHKHKKVTCNVCKKMFSAVYDLREHTRCIHNGVQLLCEICSKRFNSRHSLHRHRTMEHVGQVRFRCEMCGQKFFEKLCYLGHINTHVKSKPYVCNICTKAFAYKTSLTRHMHTLHRPTTFTCDVCGSVFNSKDVLSDHIKGKHGQRNLLCGCGKAYSWRPSLVRHKRKCKAIKHN